MRALETHTWRMHDPRIVHFFMKGLKPTEAVKSALTFAYYTVESEFPLGEA